MEHLKIDEIIEFVSTKKSVMSPLNSPKKSMGTLEIVIIV